MAPPNNSESSAVDGGQLRRWPLPEPGSDKESRGRILVVGGGTSTLGALLLAGEAALRAGAGKLQVATAAAAALHLSAAVPECRTIGLPAGPEGVLDSEAASAVAGPAADADVVLLGPGLRDIQATLRFTGALVPRLDGTVVLDALATAFVTEHPDGLRHLAGRCVLTANPTEVAHMLRREEDAVTRDPEGSAAELADRCAAVVLCGGARKVVAHPDGRLWGVEAGVPGLGVSGSGDVQAGIVGGLLARGADPAQAAVWGAWLHGTAGDRLSETVGPVGFLAREVPPVVPRLVAELTEAD